MKKLLIATLNLLFFFPSMTIAQNWSTEQQEVIDATTSWYRLWEKAFKEKDLNIWYEGFNIDENYIFWHTINDALPTKWEGNKKSVEQTNWPQIKSEYWEDFRPVAVGIYDNTAVVHFYDYWVAESMEGVINRYERKGVWTYVKRNDEWVYVSGIITR